MTVTCSDKCYNKWRYLSGRASVEGHYRSVSGNWDRYFRKLLSLSKRSETLTVEDLKGKLEAQDGKCALTGQTLTCKLVRGKRQWTNASIDKIESSLGYLPSNIQLVCSAVNLFRGNLPVQDFIRWCNLVAEHNGPAKGKKNG